MKNCDVCDRSFPGRTGETCGECLAVILVNTTSHEEIKCCECGQCFRVGELSLGMCDSCWDDDDKDEEEEDE